MFYIEPKFAPAPTAFFAWPEGSCDFLSSYSLNNNVLKYLVLTAFFGIPAWLSFFLLNYAVESFQQRVLYEIKGSCAFPQKGWQGLDWFTCAGYGCGRRCSRWYVDPCHSTVRYDVTSIPWNSTLKTVGVKITMIIHDR